MGQTLIPMDDIYPEIRKLAVVWVENYQPCGMDLPNKHKLASDIQNLFTELKEKKTEQKTIDKIDNIAIQLEDVLHGREGKLITELRKTLQELNNGV